MKKQLAEKLGQLFMVGLPGTELDDSTKRLIRKYHIPNFIYFKRNIKGRQQLQRLSQALRQECSDHGLPPPIIAIDQEGGSVARLPPPFTQFPDARELANSPEPVQKFTEYALICAQELTEVGINMNLAPVLDVCAADRNFFMERRSLGDDPEQVAKLGCLIITKMQDNGLAACGKHFPGLGAAVIDPHLELPVVDTSKKNLYEADLVPFIAAAKTGVSAIMTSHTIYQHLDPQTPATLSKKILNDLLREDLGYEGLVITDDLEMGAIEKEQPLHQAALQAFLAGADILLICHDHEKAIKAFEALADASRKGGTFLPERIRASCERLATIRQRLAQVH